MKLYSTSIEKDEDLKMFQALVKSVRDRVTQFAVDTAADLISPLREIETDLEEVEKLAAGLKVPMTREQAQEWLSNTNCMWGELDKKGFLIVDDWDTVNDSRFEEMLEVLGLDEWGFDDEYDLCGCGKVIRTSPDSYSWSPEYWLSEDEGYVCLECLKKDPDTYVEEQINRATSFILDPEEFGFQELLKGLEYGMHEGMNDDPRKIAKWAKQNNLEVVFKVYNSQFYQEFDVWIRRPVMDDEERKELTDAELEEIKNVLSGHSAYGHDDLKPEFKEWPTPATQIKEALKRSVKELNNGLHRG